MNEYSKSCEYIKHQYELAFNGAGGALYPFITSAVNTDSCERVFSAVRDTVITGALDGAGL